MIFVYYILICIAIGLANWIIIMPLLEKKRMKKFLEIMKSAWEIISDCLMAMFVIYAIIAIIFTTTNLLNDLFKINHSGVLALIIVAIFVYGIYKKIEEQN